MISLSLSLGGCAGRDTTEGDLDDMVTHADPCAHAGDEHEGEPPPPPAKAASPAASELVFAVSKLYLGGTTLDGEPSETAWTQYGFNLDAAVTDKETWECVCRPSSGAKWNAIEDGDLGRDNSFGRNLFPVLESLDDEVEANLDTGLANGSYSWLFRLQGVGDEAAYAGLTAQAYEAAPLLAADGTPMSPKRDGSDVWPVTSESVEGGDIASAKLQFVDAYTVPTEDGGMLWVGRASGTIRLTLPWFFVFDVGIHDPVVVLPISADRSEIRTGMLGGTLRMAEIRPQIARLVGNFDPEYCPPHSVYKSIELQFQQMADVLPGSAVDPAATCEDISIGIAFDAVAAQIGDVAPPVEPPPDPCAM